MLLEQSSIYIVMNNQLAQWTKWGDHFNVNCIQFNCSILELHRISSHLGYFLILVQCKETPGKAGLCQVKCWLSLPPLSSSAQIFATLTGAWVSVENVTSNQTWLFSFFKLLDLHATVTTHTDRDMPSERTKRSLKTAAISNTCLKCVYSKCHFTLFAL